MGECVCGAHIFRFRVLRREKRQWKFLREGLEKKRRGKIVAELKIERRRNAKIFGILHFGNFVKARLFMIILVILIY